MAIVTGIIHVQSDDMVPVPVDGVRVRVYASDDTFLTGGVTGVAPDEPGSFSFDLEGSPDPGERYIVRLQGDEISFPSGPTMTIDLLDPATPPASNVFDVTAHVITLPESLDPNMCLLSGRLVDASLRPLKNRVVEFKQCSMDFYPSVPSGFTHHFPGYPSVVGRNMLVESVKVRTNEDGRLQVELPRGGGYAVHIHGLENPLTIGEGIVVPDRAGFALEDVIFNYVKQVTYIDGPYSLEVGDSIQVEFDVRASNETRIERIEDLTQLVEFSSSDPDVATVQLTDKNTLTVSGVAAGEVTIEVVRRSYRSAPRRPELADLIVTPPAVVVT